MRALSEEEEAVRSGIGEDIVNDDYICSYARCGYGIGASETRIVNHMFSIA